MSVDSTTAEPATAFAQGVHAATLAHLQLIRISGADAVSFLHSQLTQDVQGLTSGDARLAAYCSAKGRMLASMVVWRQDAQGDTPAVYALVDASVAQALIKRLRMFVLRAKVVIEPRDVPVYGIWADTPEARDGLAAWAGGLPAESWQRVDHGPATWIAAPHAELSPAGRWWVIGEAGDALAAIAQGGPQASETWQGQDIRAGLPWVTEPLQELLTPLVANFDLIGGVSFTKGCYPGQEVVARSHYLGKQKRRSLLAQLSPQDAIAATTAVGADVYQSHSTGEPLGRIINAAGRAGGLQVLFEAPVGVAQTAELRLGAPDGPVMTLQPLPYLLATES